MSEIGESNILRRKIILAGYILMVYSSIVVFGNVGEAHNQFVGEDAGRADWIISCGVISTAACIAMVVLWVFLDTVAETINIFVSGFLTLWWAAGAGVAAHFDTNLAFLGFSFVASATITVMFLYEIFQLCEDGVNLSFGRKGEAEIIHEDDEQGPASEAASTELLQQQQQGGKGQGEDFPVLVV